MAHPFIPVPEMTLGGIMTNFCFMGPENYTFYPIVLEVPYSLLIGPSESCLIPKRLGPTCSNSIFLSPYSKEENPAYLGFNNIS